MGARLRVTIRLLRHFPPRSEGTHGARSASPGLHRRPDNAFLHLGDTAVRPFFPAARLPPPRICRPQSCGSGLATPPSTSLLSNHTALCVPAARARFSASRAPAALSFGAMSHGRCMGTMQARGERGDTPSTTPPLPLANLPHTLPPSGVTPFPWPALFFILCVHNLLTRRRKKKEERITSGSHLSFFYRNRFEGLNLGAVVGVEEKSWINKSRRTSKSKSMKGASARVVVAP